MLHIDQHRLLLPKDFNYNNLLEAYNPVSQDGEACSLLATCHIYKQQGAQCVQGHAATTLLNKVQCLF